MINFQLTTSGTSLISGSVVECLECGNTFDDDFKKKHEEKLHNGKRINVKHVGAPKNPFESAAKTSRLLSKQIKLHDMIPSSSTQTICNVIQTEAKPEGITESVLDESSSTQTICNVIQTGAKPGGITKSVLDEVGSTCFSTQSVPIKDSTNVVDYDKMDINWLLCAGQLENIFADLTECGIVLSKLKTEVLPNPIKFILDSVQIISRIKSKSKVFFKNANIVLEKFSGGTVTSLSNNIIDEFINHDPGGRGPSISTSQCQYLIALGPHQPKLTRYPINLNINKCKQHSFSSKWYNEYPLIEYSILKDSVYCFVCSLFPHGPDKLYSNAAWITTGVNQWHKMKSCGAKKLGKLEQHFSSTSHIACLSDYYQFMTKSNHIDIILNRHNRKEAIQLEQEKDFNKNIVIMLFDIARTLARQGLAFRGDGDESGDNFMQLVKLLSRHNPLMDRWIKETSKRSYKVHYLGPRSQNEFIELLANETRKIIVNEVKEAIIYSVSADTTPDITHEDRLAVCTRYVNNQGKAVERLLEI
ncbi:hypothetical protein QTP88_016149 [Uroleucon formosanum]